MRIFVTGATGFIGWRVVKLLIGAGHQVIGLCRDEAKAAALAAAGAEVVGGKMEDSGLLTQTAARSDGVIHLAFNHDFSKFAQNCEDDRRVIAALATGLASSDKPLVVASGIAIANVAPGRLATEDSPALGSDKNPRAASEEAARATGLKVSIVRLPQVHDIARQGLITPAIACYRQNGACAYIGGGANRWPAAHVSDVARLYRLAIERAERGAIYNAVAEEGVALRDIAGAIGRRLGLPVKSIAAEEAPAFFGWLAMFAAHDMPASGAQTQAKLNWRPTGRGLIADLEELEIDAA